MNNFTLNYEKILEALQMAEKRMNFLNQKRNPKLSDIELIAVDLTSEFMGVDSERDLFRKLPIAISSRIERSVYNRRKRSLFYVRTQLRKNIASEFGQSGYYVIDSMPLKVCKLSRSKRSTICKEQYETAPDRGYCASQANSYFGYKLHAVYTIDGIITDFDLSQASMHDIHYLKDIKHMYENCIILGDKGYLSIDYERFVYF